MIRFCIASGTALGYLVMASPTQAQFLQVEPISNSQSINGASDRWQFFNTKERLLPLPSCPDSVRHEESKFIITGRGGLPPSPSEALGSEAVWVDLSMGSQREENRAVYFTNPAAFPVVVEALGWATNSKGEVVLTAQAPTVTPHSPWITPATCNMFAPSSP